MNSKYVMTAALCFVVAVGFAAHNYNNAVILADSPGPIRNIRFTVLDEGIRPNEIRLKAGLVNISFEDKTRLGHGVRVRRRTGSDRVDIGVVPKGNDHARGRNLFRLTPGEYEVLNLSQPTQKAVVFVEP